MYSRYAVSPLKRNLPSLEETVVMVCPVLSVSVAVMSRPSSPGSDVSTLPLLFAS